jgi:cobyrinic acid a,c-diamide synthase
MTPPSGVLIAGAASGVGKTTVTLGVMAALRRRGHVVQGFKVGPDFIDPAFHALVTGRPSYVLDGWMCGSEAVRETVAHRAAGADVVVVEGMMGCFDGIDGVSDDGSTAQIAKWLGVPVVLVADARAASRSVAAVVCGFERFDPELDVAGVIVNNVGSAVHGRWVLDAIADRCRAAGLGALARDPALVLPERHLGLVTAAEGPLTPAMQTALADAVERAVDLDRLLSLACPLNIAATPGADRASGPASASGTATGARGRGGRVRIGVARDLAFQFYYEENLARLRDAGADLVFWSATTDSELPEVDGLYLGGGYPELHAAALSANVSVRRAVAKFVESGRPVYAECGGLMYLAQTLEDGRGVPHEMVGVLPAAVSMRPALLCLGYASVTTTAPSLLGPAGTTARGHEFRFSTLGEVPASVPRIYRASDTRGNVRAEGYRIGNALVSYVHLHFASNPALAAAFVGACEECRA